MVFANTFLWVDLQGVGQIFHRNIPGGLISMENLSILTDFKHSLLFVVSREDDPLRSLEVSTDPDAERKLGVISNDSGVVDHRKWFRFLHGFISGGRKRRLVDLADPESTLDWESGQIIRQLICVYSRCLTLHSWNEIRNEEFRKFSQLQNRLDIQTLPLFEKPDMLISGFKALWNSDQ